MASPAFVPPLDGDQNRGPTLVALVWTECSIAVVFIVLRFYSRFLINSLGLDDWTMLGAVLLTVIHSSIVTHLSSIGGFRHMFYLSPQQQLEVVKFNWIQQPFAVANFAVTKISVAILILRLMSPSIKRRKWFLYVVMGLTTIIDILAAFLIFFHCDPPHTLWTTGLQARCWNPESYTAFVMFQGAWFIFVDVVLAVLPVSMIWSLKMKLRKRLGLCAVLSLGLIAAICGILKMPHLASLNAQSDLTWEMYPLFAWTISEIFVIIYAGCIPTLKPLYDRVLSRRSASRGYGFSSQTYGYSASAAPSRGIVTKTTFNVKVSNTSVGESRETAPSSKVYV